MSDERVINACKKIITVFISPIGWDELKKQYGVTHAPNILFIDSMGKKVGGARMMDADEMIAKIEALAKGVNKD